jgi:hypothetical protein
MTRSLQSNRQHSLATKVHQKIAGRKRFYKIVDIVMTSTNEVSHPPLFVITFLISSLVSDYIGRKITENSST